MICTVRDILALSMFQKTTCHCSLVYKLCNGDTVLQQNYPTIQYIWDFSTTISYYLSTNIYTITNVSVIS